MIKLHNASLRQLLALKVCQRKRLNNSDSSHGVNDNHCPDFDLRALSMFIYLGLKILHIAGMVIFSTVQTRNLKQTHFMYIKSCLETKLAVHFF